MESSPPHVAVVCFPFSSHAPKLFMVARALATAAPSTAFSFLSTAASITQLRGGAAVPCNLRFVEVPTGVEGGDNNNDGDELPAWRRMELFLEAAEADGLRHALEAARAAAPGGERVTCVVGDAFMSMAAHAGVPWVAVFTGGPCALLAHLHGDALRHDIGDDAESRSEELLTSHPGLGCYRVRDLPFGGANATGDMHRVMDLLLRRLARRLPRAAAVALNAFPGLFPPDVAAALTDVLPNALPVGPLHLTPRRRHRRRRRAASRGRPPRLPRVARRPPRADRRVRQLRHGRRPAAGRAAGARRRARGRRRAGPVVSPGALVAAAPAGVSGPHQSWQLRRDPRRAVGAAGRRAAAPGGGSFRHARRLGSGRRGHVRRRAHGVSPLLRRPADERARRGAPVVLRDFVRRRRRRRRHDKRQSGGGGFVAALDRRRRRRRPDQGQSASAAGQADGGVRARWWFQ